MSDCMILYFIAIAKRYSRFLIATTRHSRPTTALQDHDFGHCLHDAIVLNSHMAAGDEYI